ncbi:MAG: ABC transporter ATP-binding protein [Acidimicrobiia bacterium]|nr:ABC transporter ATP-binding protein [Acidimicrobiia bacterium]
MMRRASSFFRPDVYRRLYPYARRHRFAMTVATGITLAQSAVGLTAPWSLKILVDNGLQGKRLPAWLRDLPFLHGAGPRGVVVFAVVAGVTLMLIGDVLDVVGQYLNDRIHDSLTVAFKCDLFGHLQRLSLAYHDRASLGDSMYRLDKDTWFISTLLWDNPRQIVVSILTLLGIGYVFTQLDWQLALIAIVVVPVMYTFIAVVATKLKSDWKRVKVLEAQSTTIMEEVLSALRIVKAFGTEHREHKRYEEQTWEAARASWRVNLKQGLFHGALGFIGKLDRAVILLIAAFHVLDHRLTIGELLVIAAYVEQLHAPIEEIGGTLTEIQMAMASGERTLELLDTEPDVSDRPGAVDIGRVRGAVALHDVHFNYPSGPEVLHGISLQAQPGDLIALVGETGAGKTTTVNLIARFYDPMSGRVTLDGHDLTDLTVRTLRENMALVLQDALLFTGSVRENIAYARPEASNEDVIAAARAANAHDFVCALPDGYNTEVGRGGVLLSGGQRQRIALARAFLRDAPILILDEPTSALDSRTEEVILESLARLMAGRTTFVIAHRLSTVVRATEILVLDHGRVVERGRHADLLARGGTYTELFQSQAFAGGASHHLPQERDTA